MIAMGREASLAETMTITAGKERKGKNKMVILDEGQEAISKKP